MKIIGIGAAGNKAVWTAAVYKAIQMEDILLMNSTTKDFPKEATDKCALISNTGGCGKERTIGKEIMTRFLTNPDKVNQFAKNFIGDNETHVVIVTSMAGGTGSGAANILGKFCKYELDCDVTIIAFRGFNEDIREISNTIEFLKELDKEFTVQIICNEHFMEESNGNKIEAEKRANINLAMRLSTMRGNRLVDSDQNIDSTDMYKIVTMPGYQQIEYSEIKGVKNHEQMNKVIKDMIDTSCGLATIPSRDCIIGIMLNIKKDTLNWFDFQYQYFKKMYGNTNELFIHIQYIEDSGDNDEWIRVIVSGLKLPIEELENLKLQYEQETQNSNDREDAFFSIAKSLNLNDNSSFNRGARRRRVKESYDGTGFLNSLNKEESDSKSNGVFTQTNEEKLGKSSF